MKSHLALLLSAVLAVILNTRQILAEAIDCNSNSIDDATEVDCNGNGIPDDCDTAPQIGFLPTDQKVNAPDMNSDGRKDYIDIATNPATNTSALRLTLNLANEQRQQSFSDPCRPFTGQFHGALLGVSDATNDGLPDVFTVCDQPYVFPQVRRAVALQENLGDGELNAPQLLYQDLTYRIDSVDDVNADGKPDILGMSISDQTGMVNAVFLVNDGTNHFSPVIFDTGRNIDLQFGDLNNDDAADILAADGRVLWNDGAGNFSAASFTDLGGATAILDVDGDGIEDVVASLPTTTSIYYSNGDKTFQLVTLSGSGSFVDFNGDGKRDFLRAIVTPFPYAVRTEIGIQSSRTMFTASFYFKNFDGDFTDDINGDGKADVNSFYTSYLQAQTTNSRDQNSNDVPDECEPNLEHTSVYTLWNTFLGMTNVLELRNDGTISKNVEITARTNGVVAGSAIVPIGSGNQIDILIQELFNLPSNSYGTIEVSVPGGEIRGGISLYHLEGDTPGSFATHIPLMPPSQNRTLGIFNNIYPLPAPSALLPQPGTVKNWLSIVNLDSVTRRFSIIGANRSILIPARGRTDIELGSEILPFGSVSATTIAVLPFEDGTPYLAHLSRYGSATAANGGRANYLNSHYFRKSTGKNIYVPISSTPGAVSYVEIHSEVGFQNGVETRFYGNDGFLRMGRSDIIAGLLHFQVDGALSNEAGYALITPLSTSTQLIVESVTYQIDRNLNLVGASDSSTGKPYFRRAMDGSYNQFLGMKNFLRINNPTNERYLTNLLVGPLAATPLVVFEQQGRSFELVSPVLVDTYGSVSFQTPHFDGMFGDVTRAKYGTGGAQFVLSTPLN